jgi:hypothetical protein
MIADFSTELYMRISVIRRWSHDQYTKIFFFVVKGPAADATDAPQPWDVLCNPVMNMISYFVFQCNGAPVEWKLIGKNRSIRG